MPSCDGKTLPESIISGLLTGSPEGGPDTEQAAGASAALLRQFRSVIENPDVELNVIEETGLINAVPRKLVFSAHGTAAPRLELRAPAVVKLEVHQKI